MHTVIEGANKLIFRFVEVVSIFDFCIVSSLDKIWSICLLQSNGLSDRSYSSIDIGSFNNFLDSMSSLETKNTPSKSIITWL